MNIAFIPVRGGSKSIPLKNTRKIRGRSLAYWSIKAACERKYIDKVYVAIDSEKIKNVVEKFKPGPCTNSFYKIEAIGRSVESASDTASTEYAMLELAETHNFENIVLIQATLPLLSNMDLDRGFECFLEVGTDSVLSVVRQKRFYWTTDKQGYAYPTNYDVFKRPRRQEFDGYMVENGVLYISSKAVLLKSRNRVSGNIKAVEMSEDTFFEIDEPGDWTMTEALMRKNGIPALRGIPVIKMLLTDCDGCLTDGGMYYSENGDEMERSNACDSMDFALLKNTGIIIEIITSENVKLNRKRVEEMKLDILEAGCKDELSAARISCEERGIVLENVAYVGDDINDIALMKGVRFSCCPADAVEAVKDAADYVVDACGGERVIREIIENLTGIDFNRNI